MIFARSAEYDGTCSIGDRQVDAVGEQDRQAVGLTTSCRHVKPGHRKHEIFVPATQ